MNDDPNQQNEKGASSPKGLLDEHPKLGILLIAGGFYTLLFGMCGFVLLIIWMDRI